MDFGWDFVESEAGLEKSETVERVTPLYSLT